MNRYKVTATEIIWHQWEIEANSKEEAREIAGDGCPDDHACQTSFDDYRIVKVKS